MENLNILKVLVSRTSYLRHVIDEVTKASSEAVKSVTLPMWKSIFISTIISNCWILPIEFEWRLTFFSFQLALCTFSTPQPTIVAIWTTLAVVTQAKPKLKPKLFIPSAIKHWLLYNLAYKIDTWSTNKVFLFCETFVWKYISTYCPRQFKVQIPTGLDHNKWSFYRQLSRFNNKK